MREKDLINLIRFIFRLFVLFLISAGIVFIIDRTVEDKQLAENIMLGVCMIPIAYVLLCLVVEKIQEDQENKNKQKKQWIKRAFGFPVALFFC